MAILAWMLELKTGTPLPQLAQTHIFNPLGMKDSSFQVFPSQRYRLAVGHAGDQPWFIRRNAPLADWDMGPLMRATGGLYSTLDDLLLLAQAALGQIETPLAPAFDRLHTPVPNVSPSEHLLGWDVWQNDAHDIRLLYVHGMVAGYSSYLGICPERQVAVIVLYNNFNWDDLVGQNLLLRLATGIGPPKPALSDESIFTNTEHVQ